MATNKKELSDSEKSIVDLREAFKRAKQGVLDIKSKYENKKGGALTAEEKNEYGNAYLAAARYAKLLAKKSLDSDESESYNEAYKKLTGEAAKYGSAVKGEIPNTTLDDVKGLQNVKTIIENFIFIANNEKLIKDYNLSGGLGLLMYGPPGTGKTLIAEAIANAMNAPFFMVTPADVFKSYVGESELSVKQIFESIDSCEEGAVLFVDECESIFSRRTGDTKDYKSAVTTELLQRMNGFGVNGKKRVMIAATNRPDMIDPAYLRFKRFSNLVFVDLPDREAKKAIIESKIPPVGLADDVTEDDILEMACQEGKNYSAADICGIIETACLNAITEMQATKATEPIKPTRAMFGNAFESFVVKLTEESYRAYKEFKVE